MSVRPSVLPERLISETTERIMKRKKKFAVVVYIKDIRDNLISVLIGTI